MGPSMIGRDAELDAVTESLRHARLVTIIGPGGSGKTTLARGVAGRLRADAHWIELAGVESGADVRAVGMRMLGASDLDTFVATVTPRTLVVLDNCEHQLAAAGALADELLDVHQELRIVATSRSDLGIEREVRYPIGPLPVRVAGDAPSAAAQLFLERSTQLGASWRLSDEQLASVQTIVERLDGIPLAIELAAAQALAVGPTTLAPLLETDPLDVLVDDRGQHRSVRATVATSLDRLDDDTDAFFSSLSVIGFPFDLELAGAVAGAEPGAALRSCNHLVRVSLLSVVDADEEPADFRVLEPIRALGQERLSDGDRSAAEHRYVDALATFADDAVARALTTYDVSTLAEAGRRFPHIVRAIELALRLDDRPDRVFRIFLPLLAPASGPRQEIVALGRRVLDRWPDTLIAERPAPPLRAEALAVMAHAAALTAEHDDSLRFAEIALADPDATSIARLIAARAEAMARAFADEHDEAELAFDRALAEAAEVGGAMERELRTTRLGMLPFDDAVHDELIGLANAAAAENDVVGLTWVLTAVINGLVLVGRVDDAETQLGRAEDRASSSPAAWTGSVLARCRAIVESAKGDWSTAAAAWRLCMERHLAHGDSEGAGVTIRLAAAGAERCDRPDVADRLWALRPPGRANTAMPLPFRDEESAIVERNEATLPLPLSVSVPLLRDLLDEASRSSDLASVEPIDGRATGAGVIRFGDGYELDPGRRELRQNAHVIHVEPQVFDVLAHLAANAGRMVSRDELMDSVWETRFVTAAAVSSRIRSARVATGDDGRRQSVIRTVHGHGFEFVARIEATSTTSQRQPS